MKKVLKFIYNNWFKLIIVFLLFIYFWLLILEHNSDNVNRMFIRCTGDNKLSNEADEKCMEIFKRYNFPLFK